MKINTKANMSILAITLASLLTCCNAAPDIFKWPFGKGSKGEAQEAVLPHDREHIAAKKELQGYNPVELGKGVIAGDWKIESVAGKKAVGETAPYLKFVLQGKNFYGNNGCNAITGNYNFNPADSTISFSNVAATMRLCTTPGITDTDINLALDAARRYSWELKGSDFYVYLQNEQRDTLMTITHRNFDFLNGTWRVTRIDETPIDNPDMKLVIDVAEGKLHGNTGCNILNGNMEIDMNGTNSICFSSIATTRMMCPNTQHETQLLVALEEASNALPINPREVVLFDSQGKQVLKLIRSK